MTYNIMPKDNSMAGFTRHGYLLHIRTQHCSNCGAKSTYTSVNDIYVRKHGESVDRQMFPRVTRIEPGYPVEHSKLPDETIPVCHQCINSFNNQPQADLISEAEWAATLKRKYAAEPPPKAAARPTQQTSHFPRNPTIDDL